MLLHKADLYKSAKARLKNDDDVFDVIQETMIVAFKTIKNLKEPLCFKVWLIKILINKSNDMYKKKSKRKIISLEEVENYTENGNSDLGSIENILDFNFICKHLKYEDRIIVALFYMERFTDREIGEILSIKENTVKTKRTRAIQEIKRIIERGDIKHG